MTCEEIYAGVGHAAAYILEPQREFFSGETPLRSPEHRTAACVACVLSAWTSAGPLDYVAVSGQDFLATGTNTVNEQACNILAPGRVEARLGARLLRVRGVAPDRKSTSTHPDTPDRIINIRSILQRGDISSNLDWRPGRHAAREEIERFHAPGYVDEVLRAGKAPPVRIDGSGTVVNAGSVEAAFAAAGTAIEALWAVLAEDPLAAYALVRPPGHHAATAHGGR
ncbi:MAG: hypothetical protein U5K76_12385 [Woeseiaceae bacterium]|nr:hypothetical protein [Woeseiaceae bacterium]